ncbi:MAG: hypothetical protein ACRD5F_16005 [Candidatus Acidiferrales bacterium]
MPGGGEAHAPLQEQERRLENWLRLYPSLVDPWRDRDGYAFRHTYFYPAEQHHATLITPLASHCRDGWGEIEIQLHHGIGAPDTAERTRQTIMEFRDKLAALGCLSQLDGAGPVRYGFVHGNWALANSNGGRACGVDNEMQILAETGCYGDFTLPSAPNPAQVRKINALYECGYPLHQRAPHRAGHDVVRGRPVTRFPLIIQGPLLFCWARPGKRGIWPYIENAAITTANPATLERIELWKRANIRVVGQPDWIFIKLHCHGMDPHDEEAMLGSAMKRLLRDLHDAQQAGKIHVCYTTAREMVNILLAACDGREGPPGQYRDYRLKLAGKAR